MVGGVDQGAFHRPAHARLDLFDEHLCRPAAPPARHQEVTQQHAQADLHASAIDMDRIAARAPCGSGRPGAMTRNFARTVFTWVSTVRSPIPVRRPTPGPSAGRGPAPRRAAQQGFQQAEFVAGQVQQHAAVEADAPAASSSKRPSRRQPPSSAATCRRSARTCAPPARAARTVWPCSRRRPVPAPARGRVRHRARSGTAPAPRFPCADGAADIEAAGVRQADIEDHQVDPASPQPRQHRRRPAARVRRHSLRRAARRARSRRWRSSSASRMVVVVGMRGIPAEDTAGLRGGCEVGGDATMRR